MPRSLLALPARLLLVVALAAAGVAGCEQPNPGYCKPGGPPCPADARGVDATTGCAAAPGLCTPDEVCLADTCVDCVDNDDTQSADCTSPALPICAADHTCRRCIANAECDSQNCQSGRCVTTARSTAWPR